MTKFFDLMVDVECCGIGETGALMAIGAVWFDLKTCTLGPTFSKSIHLATSVREGGTLDASTVLWWLGAPEKARDYVRFGGQDIRVVLPEFSDWIAETCRHEDVRPFGNSAAFDLSKIGSAYARMGMKAPWYWTNERCFRTVRNLYPQVEYNPEEKGDGAHDALTDAVFQAQHLFRIKNRNKK